eukprot:794880-Amphidinium_carterae.1
MTKAEQHKADPAQAKPFQLLTLFGRGCDIDPDVMRIIFKGKVLGEESVLEATHVIMNHCCIAGLATGSSIPPTLGVQTQSN